MSREANTLNGKDIFLYNFKQEIFQANNFSFNRELKWSSWKKLAGDNKL